MTDLTKEDQAEFKEWIHSRTDVFSCWCAKEGFKAACAYKQKRITELEEAVRASCKRIVSTNEMPEWDDVYHILIPVLHQSEGGADEL